MPKVPDFTDAAWHATKSDAELSRSILEGKGKSMPRMRDKLGSVDVRQMVAFVRAFRGGKQVVEEGEETPAEPEPERSAAPAPTARTSPAPSGPQRPAAEDTRSRDGSRIFGRSCAACHGTDGRGDAMRDNLPSIPDFSAHAWQETRTDPQLVISVLDGRGTGMPAFRDKVSREQARALVALIRSFDPSRKPATRQTDDDFEARFQRLLAEFEDLRRQSGALSGDAATAGDRPPSPATSPPKRQAPSNDPQSSGAGRP
jgi:mono/diheme cytochrome c family protein